MTVTIRHWEERVPGLRIDGEPWRIRIQELSGSRPGPATAIVAGVIGDKPLAVLALHALARSSLNAIWPAPFYWYPPPIRSGCPAECATTRI